MPTNAVYQPTTVSFEHTGPFLSQTTTTSKLKSYFRRPWMKILLLIGALFFLALGLVLFGASFADYEDTNDFEEFATELPVNEKEIDVVLMVFGVIFAVIGICLLGLYIKIIDLRRSCSVCPCSYRKKQLVRQLQGHNGGQIMALNHPSTDPLVCTQYAPVSEIPRYEDEEERKKLMQDGTTAAEESHLLPEPSDPRIVLKPSSTHE